MDTEKIVQRIEERLREWGHHHAPGCVVCITARGLIEVIQDNGGDDARVVDGVITRGPRS